MFFATGFRNENVYVFQSRGLVVTRHAMPQPIYFGWNQGQFLDSLLASAFHYSVEMGSRYFGSTSDVVSPSRDALESRPS